MKKISPIFIIGSGRSGTTIFYNTLTKHDQLTYFTNWDDKFPCLVYNKFLAKIAHAPEIKNILNAFHSIEPSKESNNIMKYCGIRRPEIILPPDYSPQPARCLKKLMKRKIYKHHQKFLIKNTNNGLRIEYLAKEFPNAKFIHVIRDGRANVYSYLNVKFFSEISFWWSRGVNLKDLEIKYGSKIRVAILHWKYNISEIIRQSKTLPSDRYIEVKYENFTKKPRQTFKKVLQFSKLNYSPRFQKIIKNTNFQNRNYKWKKNLSKNNKKLIEKELYPILKQLSYVD